MFLKFYRDDAPGCDAEAKQGWSLMATLHCILLPDKVKQRLSLESDATGLRLFKKIQVECLARRWQDRCLEVKDAKCNNKDSF